MSTRLFRALLRLLPLDFRVDYGREMERVFREQRGEATRAAKAGLWLRLARDILAIAPAEHAAQLRQDTRYALRSLRKNRAFTLVAIVTLALGIGANTVMFSVVHAVLLRPLPYADPDRLVALWNVWTGTPNAALSDPEYLDYAERTRTLDLAALADSTVNLTGGSSDPERVAAAEVTANTFGVLGVAPILGRAFEADEESRGRGDVAIITASLWRRRFAGDRAIVGRTIGINGTPHEVVGILPDTIRLPGDFGSDQRAEVIRPLTLDRGAARNSRGGHYLRSVGRFRPGVSADAARVDMQTVLAGLIRQYPDQHDQGGFDISVTSLRDDLLGPSRPLLLVLLTAVGGVLLIACANVANLLLARGESRRRELAVRTALGASRFRVVRQLLTEACLLSGAGAAAGLVVALWGQRLVLAIAPATLPRIDEVRLDPAVLLFTALLGVFTGIVFGLFPALQMSRLFTSEALKDHTRSVTDGAGRRARGALVVVQVACAVVLLVAGGLVVKSFARVSSVAAGIDVDRVLTLRVSAPPARYPTQSSVGTFFTRVLEGVRTLPGVRVAGAATGLPLAFVSGDWSFDVEGRALAGSRHHGACDWYAITPGYFEALRVPLVAGRLPSDADRDNAAAPAIFINDTAARAFFPQGDAIGQRVKLSGRAEQPWRTIAGIVGDVRQRGLDLPPRPEMYIPLAQFRHFSPQSQARALTLVIRTDVEPSSLIPAVRARLRGVDPEVPAAYMRDMRTVMAESLADRRLNVVLIGSFGVLALAIAAIGLYGVIAYHVVQRTREIGVRVAMGASRSRVLALVLGEGLRLVAIGLVLGTAVALAAGGTLTGMLFEVGPRDVSVFAGVALLLAAVGALACYLPARAATRVDPVNALRAE